jgi:hypothetical protein
MEITSEVIEKIAKACHEANRSYCAALGDKSHVPWDQTPEAIKQSCVAGVMHHLMNPDTTPEQSHTYWLEYRHKEGWTYGPEKDLDKKTHPCMVPYKDLPQEQRVKDHLFATVVKQARDLLGI